MNNSYGAALRAESEYEAIREELRYQKQIEATSTGYLGAKDKQGNIITPSGTIGAVVNDAKTLANKIVAAAQNPSELVSGVVFALVNRGINSLATKAANLVEDTIDKTVGKAVDEIIKVSGDVGKVLKTVDGYILKADGYLTEANYQAQQLNNLKKNANTSTPAPPSATKSTKTVTTGNELCQARGGICVSANSSGNAPGTVCPPDRPRRLASPDLCTLSTTNCCVR
jgi:hypothetical protein